MPPKVSARASRVWMRLGSWYGSRLGEAYGPTPPDDWVALIDRTDDERLEQGLLKVRRESPIHPPTLGQLEAAIPRRQFDGGGISPLAKLSDHVMRTRELCKHQVAASWSWFGPEEELLSRSRGDEVVRQAVPKGVVIPACPHCDKQSVRAMLDEVAA